MRINCVYLMDQVEELVSKIKLCFLSLFIFLVMSFNLLSLISSLWGVSSSNQVEQSAIHTQSIETLYIELIGSVF